MCLFVWGQKKRESRGEKKSVFFSFCDSSEFSMYRQRAPISKGGKKVKTKFLRVRGEEKIERRGREEEGIQSRFFFTRKGLIGKKKKPFSPSFLTRYLFITTPIPLLLLAPTYIVFNIPLYLWLNFVSYFIFND